MGELASVLFLAHFWNCKSKTNWSAKFCWLGQSKFPSLFKTRGLIWCEQINKYLFPEVDVYENEPTCWYFTANFRKLRCLEKKSKVQDRSQTGEDQHFVISAPDTTDEKVQFPETATSPVKTMTNLQNARPGNNTDEASTARMEGVPHAVVNPERSFGSSGDTGINVYCEHKFWSLNEAELQTIVEVSQESIAKILGVLLLAEEFPMTTCMLMLLDTRKMKVKNA